MTEASSTLRTSSRKRKMKKNADFLYYDDEDVNKVDIDVKNETIDDYNSTTPETPEKSTNNRAFLQNLKEMEAPDIISAHLESLERRMDLVTSNYNTPVVSKPVTKFQKPCFLGNSSSKNYKYQESDEAAIRIVMDRIVTVISHFHK